jgi:hypothetical protein
MLEMFEVGYRWSVWEFYGFAITLFVGSYTIIAMVILTFGMLVGWWKSPKHAWDLMQCKDLELSYDRKGSGNDRIMGLSDSKGGRGC